MQIHYVCSVSGKKTGIPLAIFADIADAIVSCHKLNEQSKALGGDSNRYIIESRELIGSKSEHMTPFTFSVDKNRFECNTCGMHWYRCAYCGNRIADGHQQAIYPPYNGPDSTVTDVIHSHCHDAYIEQCRNLLPHIAYNRKK